MATELEISAKINTAGSAQTLQGLRKELKELVSLQGQVGAGSANFEKLRDAINKTEGKLGDLNDSFATLRGSGVERLESSMGLLREGFNSFDTEKIKIGFQGMGAAMSAIPIFLIVEGLKILVENAKELYEWFTEITDSGKSLESQLKAIHKENELLNASYNNQITALEGIKGNEEEIYKIKQKQIALSKEEAKLALAISISKENQAKTEYTWKQRLLQAVGASAVAELDKAKQVKEAHENRLKAENEVGKSIAEGIKLDNERHQKNIDASKKIAEDRKKEREETSKLFAEAAALDSEDLKLKFEDKTQKISDQYVKENELQDAQLALARAKKEQDDKTTLAGEQFLRDQRLGIANDLVNGLASIGIKNKKVADALFITQKALAIGSVIVDTQKEIAAYSANPTWSLLPDGGLTLKTAAIAQAKVRAGIRIATIAATTLAKFAGNSGGGSVDSGSSGGGSIGGGAQTQAPQQQTLNNNSQLFSGTTPGQQGAVGNAAKQNITKVVVLQSDIKDAMNKVQVINDQAKF
jgi:hypothetical protein